MSTENRVRVGLFCVAMVAILTGCPGDYSGGYEKVAFRDRSPLAMASAPNPPPYIAGFGSRGPVATPVLAAALAPPGVTQGMVEEGQQLYGTICTACHGPGGTGTAAGPSLQDQNWLNIDGSYDDIVGVIQTGVPNPVQFPGAMLPMGGGSFTPEQIRALGAYVFALSRQESA